jgi:hypothetical protein
MSYARHLKQHQVANTLSGAARLQFPKRHLINEATRIPIQKSPNHPTNLTPSRLIRYGYRG